MLKLISLCLALLFTTHSFASAQNYYDDNTRFQLENGVKKDQDLRSYLHQVTKTGFHGLGYKKDAKKALFGKVYLETDDNGEYFINGVYCDFTVRTHIGPTKIPVNRVMNVEHTWPQSKGAKREPARGDLHHLFPSNSHANSARSNYSFGELRGRSATSTCPSSERGSIIDPKTGRVSHVKGFQPPPKHRGNVARAMFYVSAKYGYDIPAIEEYYLRKWHREDPVDSQEMRRNGLIEEAQGNRNPFIDFPDLVDRVDNL